MIKVYHNDKVLATPKVREELVVKFDMRIVDAPDNRIRLQERGWDKVLKRFNFLVSSQDVSPSFGRQFDGVAEEIGEGLRPSHEGLIPFRTTIGKR